MSTDHDRGFHFSFRPGWSPAWQWMWLLTTPIWVALAFLLPVSWGYFVVWLVIFGVIFGIPEYFGIRGPEDPLPPLTHMIRHFLPDDYAFPLIYGVVGAMGGRWLGVEPIWRYVGVGVFFAALGWLTTHFTVTYARPDPHPHALVRGEEAAAEPGVITTPPVIKNPRPI